MKVILECIQKRLNILNIISYHLNKGPEVRHDCEMADDKEAESPHTESEQLYCPLNASEG